MKKLISIILILCVFASALNIVFPSGSITYGYLQGDADDNDSIDSKDVLLVKKYMAGLVDEKDIDTLAADVNSDGDIDYKDVLCLQKIMAGIMDLEDLNSDSRYKVDTVSVGGRNIGRYTIVVPSDGDECVRYSATELRKYIKEACGINLNITDDESSVTSYKIKYTYDENDKYSLGKEGYNVTVDENGDVIFTCGRVRGPLYVTYFFLEEIVGYRFLTSDIVYLYEAENVNIPDGYEDTEVPIVSYRQLAQRGNTSNNFAMLRMNGSGSAAQAKYGWTLGTLYIHAHSYAYQMAGYEHIYDEAYSSKYYDTQPCLTSEENYEKIVDYCLNLLAEREGWGQHLGEAYTQISCSPNDNTNFCQCSKCKAVYAEEGSIAGTVFRMSNRVSDRLVEDYPGIEIYTIAYWDARNPPKYTRPRDNICVCFCFGGCNNHSYDKVEECAAAGGNPRPMPKRWDGTIGKYTNVDDVDYYLKWTELTNNMQVWYYSANFCYYLAPSPNLFNVYNDIKYLASHGMAGMYCEGSSTPYYSFELLRGYMAAKMMWNPLMSEEEYNDLFNEYLMIYYGAGWRYIREYINMADHAADLNGCWTNNFDRPWDMYNEDYFREHYHEMSELFDKALAAAENSTQKNRVKFCRLHCDFLGLSATYDRDWVNGSADSKKEYRKHYQFLYDFVLDNGVKVASFSNGKCGCDNFPSSGSDIYCPMEWLWEGCSGHWEFKNGYWQ